MTVVLTVLLYACESCTVYSRHARKFKHFHTKCLRIIYCIKWQDKVPDTEVITRAAIPSTHTLLQKAQVRWVGHLSRMPDDRLLKQLLYGELCYRKRSVDTLKKTLTSFNIDVTNWEVCAQDRPLWRSMIHTGARTAETNRIADAQKERAARKARLLVCRLVYICIHFCYTLGNHDYFLRNTYLSGKNVVAIFSVWSRGNFQHKNMNIKRKNWF